MGCVLLNLMESLRMDGQSQKQVFYIIPAVIKTMILL